MHFYKEQVKLEGKGDRKNGMDWRGGSGGWIPSKHLTCRYDMHLRSSLFSSTRSEVAKYCVFLDCGGEHKPCLRLQGVSDTLIHVTHFVDEKKFK